MTRRHAHATRKTPRGDTPPRPLSFGTLAGFSSERWPPSNRNTRPASSESAEGSRFIADEIGDELDRGDGRPNLTFNVDYLATTTPTVIVGEREMQETQASVQAFLSAP
ncbi:hypothetical protein FZ983_31710 [Azospirillum sp. B21]|uniref:hypothetical protein n=1 Tax=Azospirillum sp. B21 TaxID=2607496 RepID=UPI0011EE398D|nr:hypothetical protein [Azospirillum sp. B21]KAA0572514.1 hypothetical protein FZ983_31710 [Azospirillum sp. B21]